MLNESQMCICMDSGVAVKTASQRPHRNQISDLEAPKQAQLSDEETSDISVTLFTCGQCKYSHVCFTLEHSNKKHFGHVRNFTRSSHRCAKRHDDLHS